MNEEKLQSMKARYTKYLESHGLPVNEDYVFNQVTIKVRQVAVGLRFILSYREKWYSLEIVTTFHRRTGKWTLSISRTVNSNNPEGFKKFTHGELDFDKLRENSYYVKNLNGIIYASDLESPRPVTIRSPEELYQVLTDQFNWTDQSIEGGSSGRRYLGSTSTTNDLELNSEENQKKSAQGAGVWRYNHS